MNIVRYERDKKASIIAEALVVLMSGGVVVYPTETAYALGADFFSPRACEKIRQIKFRNRKKQLPVIVPNLKYASTLVRFSPRSMELASRYWPGPLTLVLPFRYAKQWPHHRDSFLGVRVSSHPFATNLAHSFGRPIVSTSANVSGHDESYSVDELSAQLKKTRHRPDLVIDAGTLRKTPPSTVVKDEEDGLVVLRKGPIQLL